MLAINIGTAINSQNFRKEVIKNADLYNLFTAEDIKRLDEILFFFDNWVFSQSASNNISLAYHTYLDKLGNIDTATELIKNMHFSLITLDSLISLCENSGTFNKIWAYKYERVPGISDTFYVGLALNIDSPYGDYLKKISKENKIIKEYIESIKINSTVTDEIITNLPKIHEYFDFRDKRFRLFTAIHFITIVYKMKYVKTYI